jgi:hypothetical protein
MLSSLPKLADKAFIIGFVLPTSLFVIVVLATLSSDYLGPENTSALANGDITKVVYFVFGVWLLSVIMLILNTALYRILEGYTWPLARCGFMLKRQKAKFDTLNDRVSELRGRRRKDPNSLSGKEEEELQDKWVELKARFPSDSSILLPTKFGNAVLAFEQYPKDVYDADGVTLWYHLSAVMPKDFRANIGDARAQVDALVNFIFYSIALAVIAAGLFAFRIIDSAWQQTGIWAAVLSARSLALLFVAIVGIIIACLSYRFSVQKAYSWGNWVRAAFDCYLPALAKCLGLRLPADGDQQRELWRSVVFRSALGLRFNPARWASIESAGGSPAESAESAEKSKSEDGSDEGGKDGEANGDDNHG